MSDDFEIYKYDAPDEFKIEHAASCLREFFHGRNDNSKVETIGNQAIRLECNEATFKAFLDWMDKNTQCKYEFYKVPYWF